MQKQSSNIERQVMASVGVIYGARLLVSRVAIELYALAVAGYALVQLTWVHMVFANWARVGLSGSGQYLSYAFFHTHLPTQLALVAAAVAGALFVRDLARTLAEPRYRLA